MGARSWAQWCRCLLDHPDGWGGVPAAGDDEPPA